MSEAALGGAAALGGSAMSAIGNAAGSHRAWKRQKALIKRGKSWQVQGMRDAGLNPILAAQGALGSMPSSPGGPSFQDPKLGTEITNARNVSSQSKLRTEQQNLTRTQGAMGRKKMDVDDAQIAALHAQAAYTFQQEQTSAAEGALKDAQTTALYNTMPGLELQREFDESRLGRAMYTLGRVTNALGPIVPGLMLGVGRGMFRTNAVQKNALPPRPKSRIPNLQKAPDVGPNSPQARRARGVKDVTGSTRNLGNMKPHLKYKAPKK